MTPPAVSDSDDPRRPAARADGDDRAATGPVVLIAGPRVDPLVLEAAIDEARAADAELVVLAILDALAPRRLADSLADGGQVGPHMSDGLLATLGRGREREAMARADEFVRIASDAGVKVRSEMRRGDPATEIAKAVVAEKPGCVVRAKARGLWRALARRPDLDGLGRELGFRVVEV